MPEPDKDPLEGFQITDHDPTTEFVTTIEIHRSILADPRQRDAVGKKAVVRTSVAFTLSRENRPTGRTFSSHDGGVRGGDDYGSTLRRCAQLLQGREVVARRHACRLGTLRWQQS